MPKLIIIKSKWLKEPILSAHLLMVRIACWGNKSRAWAGGRHMQGALNGNGPN
jgi:hypothetical protein